MKNDSKHYSYLIKCIDKINNNLQKTNSIEELYVFAKKYDFGIEYEHENALGIMVKDFSAKKIYIKNLINKLIKKRKLEIIQENNKKQINLSRILKNKLIHSDNLNNILLKYPNLDRYIGNLPAVFFINIPEKKRNAVQNRIFKILSEFAMFYNVNINYSLSDCAKICNELKTIINQKVEFEFIGFGCNGNGFKLNVGNKSFFYKAFFPLKYSEGEKHCRCAEPQYAIYAAKQQPQNFARFYCGKVCSQYDFDGFILCEFIEDNSNVKFNHIGCKLNYLYINDFKKINIINNKIVDFGGVYEQHPLLKNKKYRKLMRFFINHICYQNDKNINLITWKISKNNCTIIKNYLKKINDKKALNGILDLIDKSFDSFTSELKEKILNMNNYEEIEYSDRLSTEELLNNNLNTIIQTLKKHELRYKTKVDASCNFNQLGYIIYELQDKKFLSYFFNENNQIKRIKLEQLENKNFTQIINKNLDDINSDDINSIKNFLNIV